jgi:hypothetical protein
MKHFILVNGTCKNSGDQLVASKTGGVVMVNLLYQLYVIISFANLLVVVQLVINFGNPPFTISTGNSDANGYGNFEYAVPSGYYALNSKNLAEYG